MDEASPARKLTRIAHSLTDAQWIGTAAELLRIAQEVMRLEDERDLWRKTDDEREAMRLVKEQHFEEAARIADSHAGRFNEQDRDGLGRLALAVEIATDIRRYAGLEPDGSAQVAQPQAAEEAR